jgi:hypothetical protein
MNLLRLLNVADYAFMAGGLGVALLMIAMGGSEERRQDDRVGSLKARVPAESAVRRRRRR